jgi:hypothetical protein
MKVKLIIILSIFLFSCSKHEDMKQTVYIKQDKYDCLYGMTDHIAGPWWNETTAINNYTTVDVGVNLHLKFVTVMNVLVSEFDTIIYKTDKTQVIDITYDR